MKQKGFTLIELLAVIVILGVILVIAIPSISAAILNARKNAYVATANELVDGLRMKSLTNPEILPTTEEPTCYKPNEIKLEKGSNTRSPFGKDYTDDSQICVTYEESNDYIYSICLVDEGGNGISSNNIATINKSDVKIGEATCDGSGGDISNKEQIATGSSHTVALLEDGTVRAWGNNRDGALGNGSTTNSNIPVTVTGLTNVTQIAAGFNHTVALLADGTVRTWGKNNNGQLGNASWTSSNIPVTVTGLTNVTQIAAGEAHTVALLEDGTVRAWGYNYYGQLGNASWTNSTVPVTVTGLTNVTQIAANGYHTVALLEDGTVRTWGNNADGELGNGSTTKFFNIPVTVSGLTNVTQIAAGRFHTLALLEDGTVRTWGKNGNGELGNGSTTNGSIPVTVTGLTNVKQIAAGEGYTVVLLKDGTIRAWGNNDTGQFGNGSTTSSSTPVNSISLRSVE